MSINDLVIRGSTSISLHERFTSLRRSGGPSSSQGQSNNDNLNQSSPGPALRGAGGAPNYTPMAKMDSYDRGASYRNGGVGQSAPSPLFERYNPEQNIEPNRRGYRGYSYYRGYRQAERKPHYQPPVRRVPPSPYNSYNDDSGYGYEGNDQTYRPYSPGYENGYPTPSYMPRRTPAVEAALRLKRRSLKQRLGVRPNNLDGTNWQRNNNSGGNYLKYYGRFRYGFRGTGRARWNRGRWIRGRGGFRPRSRSMGRWGSTVSLASDGMGKIRRPRSNSFSGRRMGWTRGGRRGRGRGRWRSVEGKPPTKEELDQQIDSYMASSKIGLDKELDSYMKESTTFK